MSMSMSASEIRDEMEQWNRDRRAFLLDEDVRTEFAILISQSKLSRKKFCEKNGLKYSNVCDFMNFTRPCPPDVRAFLGIEIVSVYRRIMPSEEK